MRASIAKKPSVGQFETPENSHELHELSGVIFRGNSCNRVQLVFTGRYFFFCHHDFFCHPDEGGISEISNFMTSRLPCGKLPTVAAP
jgi:hypothetical protein